MDSNDCNSADKTDLVLDVVRRVLRRASIAMVAAILMLGFNGCCTPFGPGCHDGNCYDCDGTNQYIPMAPFQGLRQRLVCGGGGCGEVYIGEWISTPPDCPDPCCDDQFVGGANKCSPGCWTLGSLFDWRRFSGRYEGGRGCDTGCCDTGCCDTGCDSCCDGEFIGEESYFDAGEVHAPVYQGGSSGCSTCSSRGATAQTQFATLRSAPRSNQSMQYAQASQGRMNRSAQTRVASNSARPMTETQRVNDSVPRTMNTATRQVGNEGPANMRQNYRSSGSAPRTGNSSNRVNDQYDDQYDDREAQRIRR